MVNQAGSPTVSRCTFIGNAAEGSGGGMYNGLASDPVVTNCIFSGNAARTGGGMRDGASTLIN